MLAKKTSKDIFKFKIDPAVQEKEIEKLDKDKPLLYLEKHHKTNISFQCNMGADDIIELVHYIKNMKEVLLIEFRKLDDDSYHNVWGV
jgi:hypothetical protein